MTSRYPHGPDCIACTDPDQAARQIADDRARIDAEAVRAREHRAVGEAMSRRALDNLIAGRRDAHDLLDGRALLHLHLATALASGVSFDRAHLDRVEAAHPRLTALPEGAAA